MGRKGRALTSDTNPRTAVERDIRPRLRTPTPIPPLWHKLLNIRETKRDRLVDLRISLHMQRRISDWCVLPYPHRAKSIFSSSMRQRRIMQGHAHVERDSRVQAQNFVDGVLQVWHTLQIFVRRCSMRSKTLEDLPS